MISGFSNAMVIVRPFGCVRLKGGFALGVLCRLCRSRSLFRKSIFPPAGTTTTRGANTQSFWSIVAVDASAAAGAPAGGFSSQTTALRMPPCGERTSSSGFFSLPHTYWSIVTASFFSSGAGPFSVTGPLIAPPAASPGVARPVTMVMARAHSIVDEMRAAGRRGAGNPPAEARLSIENVTAASFRASVYAIIAAPKRSRRERGLYGKPTSRQILPGAIQHGRQQGGHVRPHGRDRRPCPRARSRRGRAAACRAGGEPGRHEGDPLQEHLARPSLGSRPAGPGRCRPLGRAGESQAREVSVRLGDRDPVEARRLHRDQGRGRGRHSRHVDAARHLGLEHLPSLRPRPLGRPSAAPPRFRS